MDFYVVFVIDQYYYAVSLNYVERTVFAADVQKVVEEYSPFLLGMLNIQGTLVPIVNLRKILTLPAQSIDINDQFLLLQVDEYRLGLWMSKYCDIVKVENSLLRPEKQICPEIKSSFEWKGQIVHVFEGSLLAKRGLQNV